jgi:hypothetical protein
MRYRLRVEDVREEVFFFAAARPPRAPAVRTDMVPRPLVLFFAELFFVLDFRAVARPPAAPAFFFWATLPARPPFAPALRTLIVLLLDAVFFRLAVVFFAAVRFAVDFFGVDFRAVDLRVVAFFAVDFLAVDFFAVERLDVAFLREEDDEDFVSPACARCLLTVRAAISFARFVERPCFFSDSSTCSYCRSRFALHDPWGIAGTS